MALATAANSTAPADVNRGASTPVRYSRSELYVVKQVSTTPINRAKIL